MKIIYIHQYFRLPSQGGGTRSYEFSKYLKLQGHDIHMITSTENDYEYKELIDGVNVYWIPVKYSNSMNILNRVKSFFEFMYKSYFVAKQIKNVDLCFATSTPLTVGITAVLLKKTKKIPYIFEVRDLWPEFPIQMGAIKNVFFQKLLYGVEKSIYRNSNGVVALSPGMLEGVQKYKLEIPTIVIPNSCDLEMFFPRNHNIEVKKQYGLNDKINIVHFGSMGIANGLDTILDSAEIAKHKGYSNYQFIFIGDGFTKEQMQKKTKKNNINNVKFCGNLAKDIVSEIVNICDFSIVSFKNIPILYTNSPNKLFDSLAAGKVCFVNSAGWTKSLLEDNKCGVYVDPNNPMDLIRQITNIISNPNQKQQMEINARKLAETSFSRVKHAEMLNRFIQINR